MKGGVYRANLPSLGGNAKDSGSIANPKPCFAGQVKQNQRN